MYNYSMLGEFFLLRKSYSTWQLGDHCAKTMQSQRIRKYLPTHVLHVLGMSTTVGWS